MGSAGAVISALSVVVVISALVAAGVFYLNGKKYLPFSDKRHAIEFSLGLLILLLFGVVFNLRHEPMAGASTQFLFLTFTAGVVWFYFSGNSPRSLRNWKTPPEKAYPIVVALICVPLISSLGSIIQSEKQERLAYLQEKQPERYNAIVAQNAAQAAEEDTERLRQERQDEQDKRDRACRDNGKFFIAGNLHVKNQLKSPETAEFPSMRDPQVKMEPFIDPETLACGWSIHSYVDSRNSFNALIRTPFQVVMEIPFGQNDNIRVVGVNLYNR